MVLGINVLALLACFAITRLRDLLSVRLAVALLASLADVALTTGRRRPLQRRLVRRTLPEHGVVVSGAGRAASANVKPLSPACTCPRSTGGTRGSGCADRSTQPRATSSTSFTRDLRRASRERLPLAVLMVDIDYFKAYNDMYGHQKGDECLRVVRTPCSACCVSLATIWRATVAKSSWWCCRTPIPAAHCVMRRPLSVGQSPRAGDRPAGRRSVNVAISIGIATFNPDRRFDADVMVRCADDTLYRAKREGRDHFRAVRAASGRI